MGRALRELQKFRLSGQWATLDTETTGLGPCDVVIELAVVAAHGDVLFESLARPERSVNRKAMDVHGITPLELAGAPSWPLIWPSIQKLFRKQAMLAWNAAFDFRLLRQTCDRHNLPFQAPQGLCLRAAFQELYPHVRGTLDAACLTFGIPRRPSHRARQDAEVARMVALALMDEVGNRKV